GRWTSFARSHPSSSGRSCWANSWWWGASSASGRWLSHHAEDVMIVRPLAEGQTALIGQTDHSRLVGQLAAHWGNDQYAAPEPYDSVAGAAPFPDFGCLD